jgi:hypothetical protein
MKKEIFENNLQIRAEFFHNKEQEIIGVKKSNISPGIFIATKYGTVFIPDNQIIWNIKEAKTYGAAFFELEAKSLDCKVYTAIISGTEKMLSPLMEAAGYTTI